MKIRSILPVALALVLVAAGCKKDEDSSKLYLDGSVKLSVEGSDGMPAYVSVGDKYILTPSGLYCEDDSSLKVGYYFYTSLDSKKDSIMTEAHPATSYEFTVPSGHLEQISLTCVGFPKTRSDEFYTSSVTTYFTIVNDSATDGSITNVPKASGNIKVALCGRQYNSIAIDGKTWLRENFAYQGRPYMDCKAMTNIFGGFYTWQEAQTICPSGWHLPSEAEFVALCKAAGAQSTLASFEDAKGCAGSMMGDVYFNGERLWTYYRGVEATDKVHFTAIPAGYAVLSADGYNFKEYGNYATFWTSDESDDQGVYRYIYKEENTVYSGLADKTGFLASVRCVKN